jgi:hypothetical protein
MTIVINQRLRNCPSVFVLVHDVRIVGETLAESHPLGAGIGGSFGWQALRGPAYSV